MGKSEPAYYILRPQQNGSGAAGEAPEPAASGLPPAVRNFSHSINGSRQVKSLDLMLADNNNIVMPVTEEPYITDLNLESFLTDVTDNALDLMTTSTEVGVTTTEPSATADWLHHNLTSMVGAAGEEGGIEPGPAGANFLGNLTDMLLKNMTTEGMSKEAVRSTPPTTEELSTEQELLISTARGLTDFTANIYDLLAGRSAVVGTVNDRLANGLDLANEEMDHTASVNQMWEESGSRGQEEEDFTQNARHFFFDSAEPPSGGLADYTDNVFKMLFHADELDGLLELPDDVELSNCSVWNASESGGQLLYLLDKNFLLGELVLLAVLCIPASLALILYILRSVPVPIYESTLG